ncbi:OmpA/MotB family protein [Novosphingobium sediminis]|nr:OmpA family protein [Novosphingobium sediminis]
MSTRRGQSVEEEESYFISMADMMVGLVFVFIILLIYFALQYQQKSKALSDAGEARAQMLMDIRNDIKRRNPLLQVTVDTRTGVLRLPAQILFAKGDTELSPEGGAAVITVAQSLAAVLPCYTYPRRTENCRPTSHGVDAIFIEGHTDSDPLQGNSIIKGNLELSALRATNTFRKMRENVRGLDSLGNREGRPVLSVSGYGEARPIDQGQDETAKALNRRIDLRFLMETPKDEDLVQMVTKPQGGGKP